MSTRWEAVVPASCFSFVSIVGHHRDENIYYLNPVAELRHLDYSLNYSDFIVATYLLNNFNSIGGHSTFFRVGCSQDRLFSESVVFRPVGVFRVGCFQGRLFSGLVFSGSVVFRVGVFRVGCFQAGWCFQGWCFQGENTDPENNQS